MEAHATRMPWRAAFVAGLARRPRRSAGGEPAVAPVPAFSPVGAFPRACRADRGAIADGSACRAQPWRAAFVAGLARCPRRSDGGEPAVALPVSAFSPVGAFPRACRADRGASADGSACRAQPWRAAFVAGLARRPRQGGGEPAVAPGPGFRPGGIFCARAVQTGEQSLTEAHAARSRGGPPSLRVWRVARGKAAAENQPSRRYPRLVPEAHAARAVQTGEQSPTEAHAARSLGGQPSLRV